MYTNVDAANGRPARSIAPASLEAAAKSGFLPRGFVKVGHRTASPARKALIAVSALVASLLLAKLFHRAIKGNKMLAPKEGNLLVKEGGQIVEVNKAEFLKQHLTKEQTLTQLTKDELAQLDELAEQLEAIGRLHYIVHEGKLEPFLKLANVETALLDAGDDLRDLAELLVQQVPEAELNRRLRLKRGELLRVKKGNEIVELERRDLFAQIEEGEFAQIKEEEFKQLQEQGLIETLEDEGRLHLIEQEGEFAPYLMLNAEERQMINEGERLGENFISLVAKLIDGL